MDVSNGGGGGGISKEPAAVVMDDVSLASQPHMHRIALAIITLGGLTAFALSLAAQFTRISTYSILTNPWGALYCSYPPSVATWLAVAAIAVLLFTEAFTVLTGGFTWARPLFTRHVGRGELQPTVGQSTHVLLAVLLLDILFFLAAIALLTAAAIENSLHISSVPYSTDISTIMYCSTVNQAIFISAAVLAAFSAVLMVVYYVLAIRASQDTWLRHYEPAPMVVDMEAFGRETVRTAVGNVHGEDVEGGGRGRSGRSGKGGKKASKGGRKKEKESAGGGGEGGGEGGMAGADVSVRRVAFATPPAN
ncbi:hypothetical protein CLOM_g12569 [Closterium sp. NIES-68]|nr:hypothetical protein CLOM_g12569 [Closterium sp. NIES-68]GJP85039.1 hypothetical protein CLOP_g15074 [Closterium sp. NIES-67]